MTLLVSGDLLSAASLAFGALSIFYSLWYPEIAAAINVPIKPMLLDRTPEINTVREAIRRRAAPLAGAVVVTALLLAPPALDVFWRTAMVIWHKGVDAFAGYDAVAALFVAVWGGLLGLAWLSLSAVRALRARLTKLRAEPVPAG